MDRSLAIAKLDTKDVVANYAPMVTKEILAFPENLVKLVSVQLHDPTNSFCRFYNINQNNPLQI